MPCLRSKAVEIRDEAEPLNHFIFSVMIGADVEGNNALEIIAVALRAENAIASANETFGAIARGTLIHRFETIEQVKTTNNARSVLE